jgi:hypothetical protein
MKKQNRGFIGWAGLVIAILFILSAGLFVATKYIPTVSTGGTSGGPTFNAGANFPAGYQLGLGNRTSNRGLIQVVRGTNQAYWKNTTGRTVYVALGDLEMAGTASSTFKAYVGTSTAASATNVFSLTTAPLWSQFIDGAQVATGTPAGVVADNITNHKTSYPGTLQVNSGQYMLLVASTFCTADGACNTATSTNRGWSTLTLPFAYQY